jgi:hypothetical protein
MADVAGNEGQYDDATKELITECLTPDRSSPELPSKTMFLLGDCHSAVNLNPLLLAVRGVYQIRHVYSDTVGLFPHRAEMKTAHLQTHPGRYIDVYNQILKSLRTQMKRGDVVVISMFAGNWAANNGVISRASGHGAPTSAREVKDSPHMTPVDLMERDILRDIVEPAHGKLYVLGDWPYFPEMGHGTPAHAEAKVEGQAKLQALLEPVLARHPKTLHYESLLPHFCNEGTMLHNDTKKAPKGACTWNVPGTSLPAFVDENHLTTVGSVYMWPYLCDALTA